MARIITTTGSKKVSTLQKEFNAKFPYLRLSIYPPEAKELVAKGGTIRGVDSNKTLSEVRPWNVKGTGKISFSGSRNVRRIEAEFATIFGLYSQICYTAKDGSRYYTTGDDDTKSLTVLNREKEAVGCQKDIWN